MATYAEIAAIRDEADWNGFVDKVRIAAIVKAVDVVDEQAAHLADPGTNPAPPASKLEWAENALLNPVEAGQSVINYVIATNIGATITQIVQATDSQVQNNVNAAVDALHS